MVICLVMVNKLWLWVHFKSILQYYIQHMGLFSNLGRVGELFFSAIWPSFWPMTFPAELYYLSENMTISSKNVVNLPTVN